MFTFPNGNYKHPQASSSTTDGIVEKKPLPRIHFLNASYTLSQKRSSETNQSLERMISTEQSKLSELKGKEVADRYHMKSFNMGNSGSNKGSVEAVSPSLSQSLPRVSRGKSEDQILEGSNSVSEQKLSKQATHHFAALQNTLKNYAKELAAQKKTANVPKAGNIPQYSSIVGLVNSYLLECDQFQKLNRAPSIFSFVEKFCQHHVKVIQQVGILVNYMEEVAQQLDEHLQTIGLDQRSYQKGNPMQMIGLLVSSLNLEYTQVQKQHSSLQETCQSMLETALQKQQKTVKLKMGVFQTQTRVAKDEKQKIEQQLEDLKIQHKATLERANSEISRLIDDKKHLELELFKAKQEKQTFDEYLARNGGSIEKLNSILATTKSQNALLEQELAIIKGSVKEVNRNLNRKDRESVEAIRKARELEEENLHIRQAEKVNESFRTGLTVLNTVLQKYYIDRHELWIQRTETSPESQQFSLLTKDSDVVYKGNYMCKHTLQLIYSQIKLINRKTEQVSMHMGLLARVRLILDYKYQEFVSNGHRIELNSNFADYVYWWLDEYSLHSKSHALKDSETAGHYNHGPQCLFFLQLNDVRHHNLWEVVTFMSFLNGEFQTDEIFFYLHCRNLLMRGPAAQRVATFSSLIDKIPFDFVVKLITKQFFETDSKKKDEIIERLASKTESNSQKIKFIDVNFALRVLLEVYTVEKRVFLKRLENLFNDSKYIDVDPITNSISFSKFGRIMQANFKKLTSLDISCLYRIAWNLGKGKCTFDSTVSALNYKGYFMTNIKQELK